jgi:hypothetical protein
MQVRASALRVDRTRGHGVDVDAVFGQLQGHIADEAMHAGLGGRVCGAALVVGRPGGTLTRAGGNADDFAVALSHHVRHGVSRTQEGAPQVEAQDEIPVRHRHLPDLRCAAATDVVDENVEPSETIHGSLDEARRLGLFCKIADHGQGCTASRRDARRGHPALAAPPPRPGGVPWLARVRSLPPSLSPRDPAPVPCCPPPYAILFLQYVLPVMLFARPAHTSKP